MSVSSPNDEPSVAQLFGQLAGDTATLVRQEVKLATTEIAQKAAFIGLQSLYVVIGALILVVGLVYLLAAAVIGLDQVLPLWLAALLVGVLTALIALTFILKGVLALRRMDPSPHQTIQSLQDSKTWARKQIQ